MVDEYIDLCEDFITELCPVPEGHVVRTGVHNVPPRYTEDISRAAYLVPDLEGSILVEIYNSSNLEQNLGCFTSDLSNGKSAESIGVKYATLGLAAAALLISGISTLSNGISAGSGSCESGGVEPISPVTEEGGVIEAGPGTNRAASGWHPPGFVEFFSVIQAISVSGMYSVNYPKVYRSFTQNMGWSTGVITWAGMQHSIDTFRSRTGGNLTASSYERLQQTTLVYRETENQNSRDVEIPQKMNYITQQLLRRLVPRIAETGTDSASELEDQAEKKYVSFVSGIKAYVEKLSVPNTNTFMTLLIWYAIIGAICIAGFILLKVCLELWSINGNPRNKFEGYRKGYMRFLTNTLLRLVVMFYGISVLYCMYQFKIGESWGPQLLAALTFAIKTIVLFWFSLRITYLARQTSKEGRGFEYLFEYKPYISRYGLFYDQFRTDHWWCFIPTLGATFARNAFVALGHGNGMVQIIGQLVVDCLLTGLLISTQPFNTKMGNVINLAIQIVRTMSLVLLSIYAARPDLNEITATGISLALIVIQSILTVLLAILILINACLGVMKLARRSKSGSEKVPDPQPDYVHLRACFDGKEKQIITIQHRISDILADDSPMQSPVLAAPVPILDFGAATPGMSPTSDTFEMVVPTLSQVCHSVELVNRNDIRLSIVSQSAQTVSEPDEWEYQSVHNTEIECEGSGQDPSAYNSADWTANPPPPWSPSAYTTNTGPDLDGALATTCAMSELILPTPSMPSMSGTGSTGSLLQVVNPKFSKEQTLNRGCPGNTSTSSSNHPGSKDLTTDIPTSHMKAVRISWNIIETGSNVVSES